MTKERIDEIRTRYEATSQGEWHYFVDKYNDHIVSVRPYEYQMNYPLIEIKETNLVYKKILRLADMEFIAHAHQDIPALLDELERISKNTPEGYLSLINEIIQAECDRDRHYNDFMKHHALLKVKIDDLNALKRAVQGRCYCCAVAKPPKCRTVSGFPNMISCEHHPDIAARSAVADSGCSYWQFDFDRFKERE